MLDVFKIYLAVVAVVAILLIVSMWKIYKKAGAPGWSSIVPIYNSYMLFKLFWDTKWFVYYIITTVLYAILSTLTAENLILLILYACFAVAVLIMSIMLYHKMSVAFGHGAGFTVGLIFLPFIFFPILAFGASEYQKI